MKGIAAKLIEFGMDFEYEHRGSSGEFLQSFECSIEVSITQGKIHFCREGEIEVLEENERNLNYIILLVDTACIEETTGA